MSKKASTVDKAVKKEAKKIEAELKDADREIARTGREQQRQERRLQRQARRELAMKEARKRLGVDESSSEDDISEPVGSPSDRREAMNEIRSAMHLVRRADDDEAREDAIDEVETLLDKHGEILKAKHIEKIEKRLDRLSAGDDDDDGDDDNDDEDDDKKEDEDRPGFRPRGKNKGRGRGMKKGKGGRKTKGGGRARNNTPKSPAIAKGRSRGRG